MIKAKFYKYDENLLVEMKGHAEYVKKGPDIVCSAVSALAYTIAVNAENEAIKFEMKDNPGDFMLGINLRGLEQKKRQYITNIFDGVSIGVVNIAESYPDNVSVDFLEAIKDDKTNQL